MSATANEVTRSEFARMNGWAASYVTKLGNEGRLVFTTDGKRVKVAESMELIGGTKGQRDDVAARHEEQRKAAVPARPPADTGADQSLNHAKRVKAVSEARRLAALADQEEMNRDKQAGALIAREDVEFAMNDFGAMLRQLMDNFADRLAPEVYPLTTLEETHARISEAAESVLHEMAETMKRRAREFGHG